MGEAVARVFGGLGGRGGEEGARVVSLDTCRAIVFDLLVDFAGNKGASAER